MLPRDLRQYSNRKVFITTGAIIGLSFITTAAAVVGLSALLVYRQGAQNYNDNRVQLALLSTNLQRAGSLAREYVISQDQADLGSYRQVLPQIQATLDSISGTPAPSGADEDMARLPSVVAPVLQEQDRLLALVNAGQLDGARAALQAGTEAALMSQVDALINRLNGADLAQLVADRQRINLLARISRDINLASLAMTLILAITLYYLYLKGIQAERRLDRAKDEFVSLASHQLRTPATGVKSILAMLVAGDLGSLSPRQLHFANKAAESNERGLAIIEELLNVAKADAGRLVLNETNFDLSALVEGIVNEQQPQIDARQLKLNLRLPNEPLELTADRDKLYMAIGNLIDNARKYTPAEGTINVSLSEHFRDIRLSVADTGMGIPRDELPHIFERFGRARDVQGGQVEGTGLGLYLVNRVVELHQGRIRVTSRKGKGSKFVMIIPKRKPVNA